jgi:hypothetical protein
VSDEIIITDADSNTVEYTEAAKSTIKIVDSSDDVIVISEYNPKISNVKLLDIIALFKNYYNKLRINNYTGATNILINNKQDVLIAGSGISIVDNTINAIGGSGSTLNATLQLLDTIGGVNVNNIIATPIIWSQKIFTGTSLTFTGGSRIYIRAKGVYGISYVLNVVNSDSNDGKNIGTVIRKNGNTDITSMSSVSFVLNLQNDSSTNMMPEYLVSLLDGDYIELMAFRIEYGGTLKTKKNCSWIKIKKII